MSSQSSQQIAVAQNVAEYYQAGNLGALLPAGGLAECLFEYRVSGSSDAWVLELCRACSKARRYLLAGKFNERYTFHLLQPTATNKCPSADGLPASHDMNIPKCLLSGLQR